MRINKLGKTEAYYTITIAIMHAHLA